MSSVKEATHPVEGFVYAKDLKRGDVIDVHHPALGGYVSREVLSVEADTGHPGSFRVEVRSGAPLRLMALRSMRRSR